MSRLGPVMNTPQSQYQPYLSDDDDDDDEESDIESEDEKETEADRRKQDPRFALLRAPTQQRVAIDDQFGKWDPTTNIDSIKGHVYLDPPKTTKTSLICIKSLNRDRNVYPSPYRFQLKLPRVYKNVTKFQLVQLSFPNGNSQNLSQAALLTSTVVRNLIDRGIPAVCISDCISLIDCSSGTNTSGLIEQGRVAPGTNEPLLISLSVPDGTYTESQLANELTFRANSTPPFNIIKYEEFRDQFMVTRDINILFNEPSECYYSAITHRKYGSHTKQDIMNAYYTQQHLDSFPEITERIAFNAYYYPILKEMLVTGRAEPFLQTDLIPFEEVVQRVTGIFEGLDSEFYYQLAQRNRGALDVYRRHFTFEYRNINKYMVTYNEQYRKSTVVHDMLHPSLQKDLMLKQNYYLNQNIALSQLNPHSFSVLKQEQGRNSAILKHLETNLSSVLANYHLLQQYRYQGGNQHIGLESTITAEDLDSDIQFTTMFNYTSSFGGMYGNYPGAIMKFETFKDYHSTLSSYYTILQSTQCCISTIHGQTYQQFHQYVVNKYTGVLPQTMIDNRTYTVPNGVAVSFLAQRPLYIPGESVLEADNSNAISYSISTCKLICCSTLRGLIGAWYSGLPTNFVLQTLPYRLGLINTTPNKFNFLSTVMNITSTGNLNLFMQINEEMGFNNIDVTMPENYNVSNETTGQVKFMSAKILMGALGDTGTSQTVIQNPALFENGLGKLDKLDIKIYYDDQNITPAWIYQPYYLDILEWNATFQIDEEIGFANRATGWGNKPTIPIPDDPDKTPYLFVTHKSNPNNS
jgi:hypothetical protein